MGRNDPCSCGSGRKVKRCCGVDGVRRRKDAAAELFSLAFHFPRYRPATAEFDAWAWSASASLDRETVAEGLDAADYGRAESLLAAQAERLATPWHRERLDVLLVRLRAWLPDAGYPLASAALQRACERVEADETLARRLCAELLLDSLPRVLAPAA